MSVALDHVFVFVESGGRAARARLDALGFTPTYARAHPGQGTANVCYAFEDAFLELLWLVDEGEARGECVQRTGLADRAAWRSNGASPFGVAWRPAHPTPIPTWAYAPSYLPPGLTIPVATASDDPRLPMLFGSPGTSGPADWPPERRGALQRPGRMRSLGIPVVGVDLPHPDLTRLAELGVITVRGGAPGILDLPIGFEDGRTRTLRLPDLCWVDSLHDS